MQNTRGARELEVCIAEIIASVVVSVFASKPLLCFKKKGWFSLRFKRPIAIPKKKDGFFIGKMCQSHAIVLRTTQKGSHHHWDASQRSSARFSVISAAAASNQPLQCTRTHWESWREVTTPSNKDIIRSLRWSYNVVLSHLMLYFQHKTSNGSF